MIRQNLHTHTVYDDGKNTPPEMAQAALDAGLASLGFSGHSILPFDNDWAMTALSQAQFMAEVSRTRYAFSGRLSVFCGLEWDLLSAPPEGFDYIIGSIHHLPVNGGIVSVDESRGTTEHALTGHFGGDADAYARAYYAQYEALAGVDAVDIVGHFDLLTKFNEPEPLFDENSPKFLDAAISAMETLLKKDKIFEVNTGAMQRGYRTAPYPSVRLLRELKARNARILVSSDAHSADGVAFAFAETEEMLRSMGFRELWTLTEQGFAPTPIS